MSSGSYKMSGPDSVFTTNKPKVLSKLLACAMSWSLRKVLGASHLVSRDVGAFEKRQVLVTGFEKFG
jgi:hypothetical protein